MQTIFLLEHTTSRRCGRTWVKQSPNANPQAVGTILQSSTFRCSATSAVWMLAKEWRAPRLAMLKLHCARRSNGMATPLCILSKRRSESNED